MYLNHITLATGHNRRSPSTEVSPTTLAWLRPWLDALLSNSGPSPLPESSLAHYSATAHIEHGGLVVTVFCGVDSIVTFAVAERSRQSAELWAYMRAQYDALPGLACPGVPWLAVALRDGLVNHADAMGWLGDFERCVAWTWLGRNI